MGSASGYNKIMIGWWAARLLQERSFILLISLTSSVERAVVAFLPCSWIFDMGLSPLAPAAGGFANRQRRIERATASGRYETGPKSC